jgi:hypothetical protein
MQLHTAHIRGISLGISGQSIRLFGQLSQQFGGCQFQSNEEVELVVCEWLGMEEHNFYCDRTSELIPRLDIFVITLGDYVDK